VVVETAALFNFASSLRAFHSDSRTE
jgi:hypothetical protein